MATNLPTIGQRRGLLVLILTAVIAPNGGSAQPTMYNFTTIAGSPSAGGTDGTNSDARFHGPCGITLDNAGNVFVADAGNYTVRKLTPVGTNWASATIAGAAGFPGNADGTNGAARFFSPRGVAADSSGSLYVADAGNSTIRKLTPFGSNWVSTTIAGVAGGAGSDDGTNNAARFGDPVALAIDNRGSVFVADLGNHTIRRLAPAGTNWVCSTIAGLAGYPTPEGSFQDGTNGDARFGDLEGITVDGAGNVYVVDASPVGNFEIFAIRMIAPLGTNWITRTIAPSSDWPRGLTVAGAGSLYVAFNAGIARVQETGSSWTWTTIAGGITYGSADGTNATTEFYWPTGVAAGPGGNIYVADTGNNTIRRLTPSGGDWVCRTVAGLPPTAPSLDGTNQAAHFSDPGGLALGTRGEIYVADSGANAIREIDLCGSDRVTRTIAGLLGTSGSADGTNTGARFNRPQGVAMDNCGNILYVADTGSHTIRALRQLGTNWVSQTVAGMAGSPGSADGTNSSARFNGPRAIALDANGILYIADTGNSTIRQLVKIGADWVSTTIVGTPGVGSMNFDIPNSLAIDAAGNIYVADGWSAIRQVSPIGGGWQVATIAGTSGANPDCIDGTNEAIQFISPLGVSTDTSGALYCTDSAIRKLALIGSDWVSSTVGGECGHYGSADGINHAAGFSGPGGIALDSSGNIYVTDFVNNTIRMGLRLQAIPPPPLIQSIRQSNGWINLTWSATVGLSYRLQYCSNLIAPEWIALAGRIDAFSPTMSASDLPNPDRQRFYRVVLLP